MILCHKTGGGEEKTDVGISHNAALGLDNPADL